MLPLFFSVESLQHIDKESFHVLHLFLALDMFENAENQQFATVFVSARYKTMKIFSCMLSNKSPVTTE